MKKEIADLWVQDLREHPELQGKGQLGYRDDAGRRTYCCLGRLGLILHALGFIPAPTTHYTGTICFGDGETSLTQRMMDVSGVRNSEGRFSPKDFIDPHTGELEEEVCLASLNDEGRTFLEIADIIEDEWEQI